MHINKNHKSYIFETYAEAKFYQARYGGTINYTPQHEERRREETSEANPLDNGLDVEIPTNSTEFVPTGKILYFLNIHAQADMTNGFRYIKELLAQRHNFTMNEAWRRLQEAGVRTYTVKTDAVTIGAKDLERVQMLLDFVDELYRSSAS